MTETRYQRVYREQLERKALREAKLAAARKAQRKVTRRATSWYHNANHVDGYDRDDIGLSHD